MLQAEPVPPRTSKFFGVLQGFNIVVYPGRDRMNSKDCFLIFMDLAKNQPMLCTLITSLLRHINIFKIKNSFCRIDSFQDAYRKLPSQYPKLSWGPRNQESWCTVPCNRFWVRATGLDRRYVEPGCPSSQVLKNASCLFRESFSTYVSWQ